MFTRAQVKAVAIFALGGLGAACTPAESTQRRPDPPLVEAGPPRLHRFADRLNAVGTARANEQVVLSASVTGRLVRLNFDDGALVRRGQVVAVLQQEAETAGLAGALATQRQAEQQLDRVRALSERGFATKALLDEQTSMASRAQSAVGEARARISDRVVTAPFTGFASLRTISAGAVVSAGTPIVTISDISRIKLDFTVPETLLSSIREGQSITAIAAAFPQQRFTGRIATVDPVIDPATRAVSVRALLPNPGNVLKPGMLLTVVVEASSQEALSVPELAVLGEGAKRYVFIVGAGDKTARVPVTTGLRDNGLIQVSGLKGNEAVIQEGIVKVAEGMRVRVKSAARQPGAGN